jgi:hypothetical protein
MHQGPIVTPSSITALGSIRELGSIDIHFPLSTHYCHRGSELIANKRGALKLVDPPAIRDYLSFENQLIARHNRSPEPQIIGSNKII